ncbi:hypothetical protein [Paracoccus laeviglucosivorans]|uniref:5-deoxyglucuronate isomerase n=1 Tax=Paracoccus laeviglucosivorans TaxID=1197861 RepID=A0A521FE44_9RHOB|nr:hypothetical protein [Paracoccus laeviglucosivorans]SMO94472.1 hypothetical protein SAMN06265221_1219 [Paracoccus laeviglucosivorans]
MFQGKDPRADLFAGNSQPPATGLIAQEQLGRFHGDAPQVSDALRRSWYLRGCNFVLEYSELAPGAKLGRQSQPDEYVLYLDDRQSGATVEWNGTTVTVPGGSIVFVPPGDSCITFPSGAKPVRLFTVKSADLVALCPNADGYRSPRSHIPPFHPWPKPAGGWKVRHYPLDVADQPGRFGRIYRCTTFMVNALPTMNGPRDPARMSPHHHDDFEQCSLALQGSFTHFLRWSWTTDMSDWREDMAVKVGSPSALVIPPPVIHTTQATGTGHNDLVDIFCPPRMDFSQKPGWVLNAEDYPIPDVSEQDSCDT